MAKKNENDLPGAWDRGGKRGGSKDGPRPSPRPDRLGRDRRRKGEGRLENRTK